MPAKIAEFKSSNVSVPKMGHARDLWEKLETRQARIGVIGLGYVGLPLAVEYAQRGFPTLGIDLNRERVLRLNAGANYIQDIDDASIKTIVESGTFVAEDDFSAAGTVDVFFICVPTPVTAHKDPDTSYISSATQAIAYPPRPAHHPEKHHVSGYHGRPRQADPGERGVETGDAARAGLLPRFQP
jgi:UDP-glucose/GDP-mannose dehydrogenase family, NAD binding domain